MERDKDERIQELLVSVGQMRDRAQAAEKELLLAHRKLRMAYGRMHELDNPEPSHKHVKTGGLYRLEGEPLYVGDTRVIQEGDQMSFYTSEFGKSFCRLKDEFDDGRFENIETWVEACLPEAVARRYDPDRPLAPVSQTCFYCKAEFEVYKAFCPMCHRHVPEVTK